MIENARKFEITAQCDDGPIAVIDTNMEEADAREQAARLQAYRDSHPPLQVGTYNRFTARPVENEK